MNLSAFGVESDDYPSIDASIDFINTSNSCKKWYYNNALHKTTMYTLSKTEMKKILRLLQTIDLEKFKKDFKVGRTDQPTSKTIIHTRQRKFVITDYGLQGDDPLPELYKIVYKL